MAEKKDKKQEKDSSTEEPLNPPEMDEAALKKSKIKKMLLIIVPILVIIIGGAVYFFVFAKKDDTTEIHKEHDDASAEGHEDVKEEGHDDASAEGHEGEEGYVDPADAAADAATDPTTKYNAYLDIDPITTRLTTIGNKREHLRLDLTLRLSNQRESHAISAKMPIIKDALIVFLRTLRSSDFNNSSNTLYLKEEIIKRINKITAPIIIKEVLFQEITVN